MFKYKNSLNRLHCRDFTLASSFAFIRHRYQLTRYWKMLLLLSLSFSFAAAILAKTSSFKLELSWDKGAPDGYERDMIFINGQYPGPALEITQGDWVEIEVLNNLPFNSSIHAHGMYAINCWFHRPKLYQAFIKSIRHGQMESLASHKVQFTLELHTSTRGLQIHMGITFITAIAVARLTTAATVPSSSSLKMGLPTRFRSLILKGWNYWKKLRVMQRL